jgi:hypothetical protein
MINKFKLLTSIALFSLVSACGGGGGGDGTAAPVASTQTFPLKAININLVISPSSENFTISGTLSGAAITGSGTVTSSNLSAGTFEGLSALQGTSTTTGSYVANGVTYPINSLGVFWYDSNYVPKGRSSRSEYSVVTVSPTLPTAVRINDTGTFVTVNRYTSSTKAVFLGTETESYVIEADTASTALLTVISVEKNTSGITTNTSTNQYRITPTGTSTRTKSTSVGGATSLEFTF